MLLRRCLVLLGMAAAACNPGEPSGDRASAASATGAGAAGPGGAGTGGVGGEAAGTGGVGGGVATTAAVLRVHYPAGAHTLLVRGSDGSLDWMMGEAMTLEDADTWVFTSTALTGTLEWKPLLDDVTWSRGPNYHAEPGQTVDIYPHFTVTQGKVEDFVPSFHSAALGNDRRVWVYLPPTYLENALAAFPVVYMHDGQNLFDAALAFGGNEWNVDETFDAAAEDGSIREAIVVAPENTPDRIYEYTPTYDASVGDGGGGDLYLTMLTDELRPLVEAQLRTLGGPDSTVLLGSSLGGLISSYGGLTHPDVFGLVGAMSPSTWWDNLVIVADVTASAGQSPRALRVYLDSGDSGASSDGVADTNTLAQTYVDVGYTEGVDFQHVVQPGGQHSEIYWAQRLPGALAFLLGPRDP